MKLRYYNQEQLLEVAREYKRRKLPIDVIVVDFFHWPKKGDFRFEEEFFPDPKAMVETKINGDRIDGFGLASDFRHSENFEEMKQKGYLVKPEMGAKLPYGMVRYSVFYDATNPKARNMYGRNARRIIMIKGSKYSGWMKQNRNTVYMILIIIDTYGTNVQIGNIYPKRYSRAFYEGMQAEGQDKYCKLGSLCLGGQPDDMVH